MSFKEPLPPQAVPLPRAERSTSANHTSLTLVILGRFPIRPVAQSISSYGLAFWTGQQWGGLRQADQPPLVAAGEVARDSVTVGAPAAYMNLYR